MTVANALRAVAVVVAVGAAYFLMESRAADDECERASARVFSTSGGFEPLAGLEPAIDDLRRECDGASALLNAAETIRQASIRRSALTPLAQALAREGTRIEPDNYIAWVTLAAALARTDADAAYESLARARELNPRLVTPASIPPRAAEPR